MVNNTIKDEIHIELHLFFYQKIMTLATNRKANYEYNIIEEFSAGIVLLGSEVKSIRGGNLSLQDTFIYLKSGEVWIKNLRVSKYKWSHPTEIHDENRDKKLLLTKKQIQKIGRELQSTGVTCIALSVYTVKNRIKVNIAIAKGKKNFDKRQSIKQKDIKRELQRNGY